jgi:hypothetical protein
VSDGDAVVDDLTARPRRIPCGHIARAHFELERGGDAVADHHAVGLVLLPVLVQIHEPRRDDQVGCVDQPCSGKRRLGDGLDRSGADADVPHGVETRLGIHHPAVGDDEVVTRGWLAGTRRQRHRDADGRNGEERCSKRGVESHRTEF